ncbi:hypothetical protein M9Y10_005616 [Tritrichomonas musculus]|uniref:DUF3447 domain-containing protein n=1 Tax=Tritrichomonas musculus TaxID=1915356 RepID=A0ABR2JC71_9EUKA
MNPKPNKSIFHSSPLPFPKVDTNEYLKINKKRYEIISAFQNQVNNITSETYPSIIKYVEDNSECFLKDNDTAVLFLRILNHFIQLKFKEIELIIDIGIYFSDKVKQCKITETDIIRSASLTTINYLFMKNAISIETIIEKSKTDDLIFINFYPEIKIYEQIYIQKKEKIFKNGREPNDELIKILEDIKKNPENHILNRNNNYYPSPLYKAIVEDDVDTFQSILSKNNFSVNYIFENSIYERVHAIDYNLSLLQVAAIYGSLNVFKFLWMQSDIDIKGNLLCYAYSGRNRDIIHLCEQKCSFDNVINFAISSHQNDLVDYFIENFEDKLIEDDEYILNYFQDDSFNDDNDNPYKKLPFNSILIAFRALNYNIIHKCINKIVFLIENLQKSSYISLILANCMYDLELFRFMLAHQNRYPHLIDSHGIIEYDKATDCHALAAIKVVISYENMNFLFQLLNICVINDPTVVDLILDLQKAPGWDEFHEFVKERFHKELFLQILLFCSEETIIKTFKLYNCIESEDFLDEFALVASDCFSKKMFESIIEKLSSILSKETMKKIKDNFENKGNTEFAQITSSTYNTNK